MTLDQEISAYEASLSRLQKLDEDEVDPEEYERILARLVELRKRRDAAPHCPKHPDTKMTYADGMEDYHDLKTPHWRCELWIGSGVCGATLPLDVSKVVTP